ncbi:hypothetical protein [Solilutibacter silvestris]|uniref:Uncharacterized protein n=1 Tax=Solilutibacter silvestris TaxID=1645665 RepID=A0A2K1Q1E6_9GAMM|nr:hypothetical protein [Lysobacter silvestris]PNS08747.1 hypothetical protein Lysil_0376 [Lysobacter silvestris]
MSATAWIAVGLAYLAIGIRQPAFIAIGGAFIAIGIARRNGGGKSP